VVKGRDRFINEAQAHLRKKQSKHFSPLWGTDMRKNWGRGKRYFVLDKV
jgi:hypothetical protein